MHNAEGVGNCRVTREVIVTIGVISVHDDEATSNHLDTHSITHKGGTV